MKIWENVLLDPDFDADEDEAVEVLRHQLRCTGSVAVHPGPEPPRGCESWYPSMYPRRWPAAPVLAEIDRRRSGGIGAPRPDWTPSRFYGPLGGSLLKLTCDGCDRYVTRMRVRGGSIGHDELQSLGAAARTEGWVLDGGCDYCPRCAAVASMRRVA